MQVGRAGDRVAASLHRDPRHRPRTPSRLFRVTPEPPPHPTPPLTCCFAMAFAALRHGALRGCARTSVAHRPAASAFAPTTIARANFTGEQGPPRHAATGHPSERTWPKLGAELRVGLNCYRLRRAFFAAVLCTLVRPTPLSTIQPPYRPHPHPRTPTQPPHPPTCWSPPPTCSGVLDDGHDDFKPKVCE